MKSVQIGEFKAQLSSILEQVNHHKESYVIEYGRNHKKVAMLVPYNEEKQVRRFGLLEGQCQVPDDFDNEVDEINQMFYGK